LIVTLGVPGQATAPRDVSAAPVDTINPERVSVKTVKVDTKKADKLDIQRASFIAEPKPEPEPVVIAVADSIEPTTRQNSGSSDSSGSADSMAPMTRQNRGGNSQQSAPTQKQETKKETSAPSSNLTGIAATASKYSGVPYVWGGNTPSGWDCSGFVKYVYAQHGINIARGTSAILGSGQFKRTSSPKPGDLVFQNGGGHVGIYLGGGQMIGAQNPTVDTMIHSVTRNPLYGYYTLAG
jgi:cell wall-associated NlpC family hydrolase